ncbi:MAG: mechanosensitive ion channel domain-containing protein [Methanoregula sp.]|jgi:small-conductance mechanosensitive channel
MADGILESTTFPLTVSALTADIILYAVLILVIAYFFILLLSFLLTRIAERVSTHRTQILMIIPFAKIVIYAGAIYLIASTLFKPDIAELVAFFGLFGAILAFGVKDLFTDIVGGLVIIVEKPFQIGDKITFGGYYGEVADIGLRSTKILTSDESLVSVPNDHVFSQPVSSSNAGEMAMLVVTDLYIDGRCNAEKALAIAREAAITSKYAALGKSYPVSIRLNDFPFYRQVRVKAFVSDIRNEFQFKSDITRRAWDEMRRQGIRPPVPGMIVKETG